MTHNDLADPPRRQFEFMQSQITELEQQNDLLSRQAASMSNTLADYASRMNSLGHYIIDNEHSTGEAKAYADETLDFITPYLESG